MNQYVAVTAEEAAIPRDGVIKLHGAEAFEGMRVGRNDPCPCGSGKKYKQCHGKLA